MGFLYGLDFKMLNLFNLIYRFNTIPVEKLACFLLNIKKLILEEEQDGRGVGDLNFVWSQEFS